MWLGWLPLWARLAARAVLEATGQRFAALALAILANLAAGAYRQQLLRSELAGVPVSRIGTVRAARGLEILDAAGAPIKLARSGLGNPQPAFAAAAADPEYVRF